MLWLASPRPFKTYCLNSAFFRDQVNSEPPGAMLWILLPSYSFNFSFSFRILEWTKQQTEFKMEVRSSTHISMFYSRLSWLWASRHTSSRCFSQITAYWPTWLFRLTTLLFSCMGHKDSQASNPIGLGQAMLHFRWQGPLNEKRKRTYRRLDLLGSVCVL